MGAKIGSAARGDGSRYPSRTKYSSRRQVILMRCRVVLVNWTGLHRCYASSSYGKNIHRVEAVDSFGQLLDRILVRYSAIACLVTIVLTLVARPAALERQYRNHLALERPLNGKIVDFFMHYGFSDHTGSLR